MHLLAASSGVWVKTVAGAEVRNVFGVGRPAGWLGMPVIATSHTWENGKNEHSHQDTTFCEALLGEMGDVSRVLMPADYNSTLASLPEVWQRRGEITCMVIPKRDRPCYFTSDQAEQLARDGAVVLRETAGENPVLLMANGSYQLGEALRAAERLADRGVGARVVYIQEPGRFRYPRDCWEQPVISPIEQQQALFPDGMRHRIALTHMRPEVFRGHLWPLLPDVRQTAVLGYINRGGTLDEPGMLFINRCTWAHALQALSVIRGEPLNGWLSDDEVAAVEERGNPRVLV